MKVLMVIERYSPIWGGAENQLQQLCSHLVRNGCDVSVVTRRWESNMPSRDLVDGVPVRRVGLMFSSIGGNLAFSAALFWYLLRHGRNTDIIHSHGAAVLGGLCTLAARLTGSRCVVKIATAGRIPKLEGTVLGRSVLALFKRADFIVCLSEEIRVELGQIGVSENRIVRLPNAVDTDRFQPFSPERRRDWRRDRGIRVRDPLVVFSGRLVPRKGAGVLLEAWPQVTARHPDAQLVLLGDGRGQADSVEEALRRKVEHEGIANVTFGGATGRPEDFLGAADVLVLPSFKEGFPNALLEAMAAGMATVSSRIGGVVDLVVDGDTGLVVPPGDADALADCISFLLASPGVRREMGERARSQVLETYTCSKIFAKYHMIYSLLERVEPVSDGSGDPTIKKI